MNTEEIIKTMYKHFNSRDIDAVLTVLSKDIKWANGWEGGYVYGHEGIRDYWTRQWKEINPIVTPVDIIQKNSGKIEVTVHQFVKDLEDKILFDGTVFHYFTVNNGLITIFDIGE